MTAKLINTYEEKFVMPQDIKTGYKKKTQRNFSFF